MVILLKGSTGHLEILGTLQEEEKSSGMILYNPLVHSYNGAKNDMDGFSPYQFRRQPNHRIDVAFQLNSEKQKSLMLTMRKSARQLEAGH